MWSNVPLLVVGIWLLTQPKAHNFTIGASLIMVFFGSLAFHVTESVAGLNLDRIAMCFAIGALRVTVAHVENGEARIDPLEYVVASLVPLLGVVSCNRGLGRLWITYRVALATLTFYVAIRRQNAWLAVAAAVAIGGDLLACIRPLEVWLLRMCGFSGHAFKHVLMALAFLFVSFAL